MPPNLLAQSLPCDKLPSCSGKAYIKVDIENQCMCVGIRCFKVGVGANKSWNPLIRDTVLKPIVRDDGVGLYQTNMKTTTAYDDDAVAMSDPAEVWERGTWLHKTRDCKPTSSTKGCISVPCNMWPMVKESLGKSITVCRGKGENGTNPPLAPPRSRAIEL